MAWSIDNPVIGEYEDLVPQPLPYRTTFVPVAELPAPIPCPLPEPIDSAPPSTALTVASEHHTRNETENAAHAAPSAEPTLPIASVLSNSFLSPVGTSSLEPDNSLSGILWSGGILLSTQHSELSTIDDPIPTTPQDHPTDHRPLDATTASSLSTQHFIRS